MSAYAECGNIVHAARRADIDKTTHYWWMEHDADYPERFAEAHKRAKSKGERCDGQPDPAPVLPPRPGVK